MAMISADDPRITSRLSPGENGCVNWTGALCNNIPLVFHDHTSASVRRIMYRERYGVNLIKTGPCVLGNPRCVNPEHLRPYDATGKWFLRMTPRRRKMLAERRALEAGAAKWAPMLARAEAATARPDPVKTAPLDTPLTPPSGRFEDVYAEFINPQPSSNLARRLAARRAAQREEGTA